MMKTFLVSAVMVAGMAAAPAKAQLNPFSGWSMGLNPAPAFTAPVSDGAGLAGADREYMPAGQAAFGLTVGSRYHLGLGMSVGVSDWRSGAVLLSNTDLGHRLRNRYTLYAEPGLTLGQATLIYGKLSYLGGRGDEGQGSDVLGKTYASLGLGAGVRTMLGESLFLQVELLYGDYGWRNLPGSGLRPSTTSGSVGLGWRF